MLSNTNVGTYTYPGDLAPRQHTPTNAGGDPLSYDANGNMTVGLSGKQVTYDYNNRPTNVQFAGQTTTYTYGPEGGRATKTVGGVETWYSGFAEVRDIGGAGEQTILQPHADFRLVDGVVSYLHRDHLSSVRMITNAAGQPEQSTNYTPFGDPTTATLLATSTPEEHSFIGERFDASTGLLYLNARYMDPLLGRFIQPDWWEVRIPGVGTNRYAYSFNDPVNLSDRNGNLTIDDGAKISADIYDPGNTGNLDDTDIRLVTERELERLGLTPSSFNGSDTGLNSALYLNTKTNEYTLAFGGTVDFDDGVADVAQLYGFSSQYSQAVKLSRRVSSAVASNGGDLSFTGHSLGGGLAAASANARGINPAFREAKTYNAAGVSFMTRTLTAGQVFQRRDIVNTFLVGDALTAVQSAGFAPSARGRSNPVFPNYGQVFQAQMTGTGILPLEFHRMEYLLQAMGLDK